MSELANLNLLVGFLRSYWGHFDGIHLGKERYWYPKDKDKQHRERIKEQKRQSPCPQLFSPFCWRKKKVMTANNSWWSVMSFLVIVLKCPALVLWKSCLNLDLLYYISDVTDVEDGLRPMVKPPHVNLTCTVCIVSVKNRAAGGGARVEKWWKRWVLWRIVDCELLVIGWLSSFKLISKTES